jgi:hypothetical protein
MHGARRLPLPPETAHRSPQLPLWELGDGAWLTVVPLAPYALRKKHRPPAIPYQLFPADTGRAHGTR